MPYFYMGKTKFIDPHPKQLAYLNERPSAKIRLALAGRQGGKTEIGCIAFAKELRSSQNEEFMVVAPTYKDLHQATMVKLENVLRKMHPKFIIRRDERIRMFWNDRYGNTIYFRTTENPDRLRGPTLKAALYDEAAMTPTGIGYRTLIPALSVKKGTLWITTTPKGPNWILQEIIKPWRSGAKDYHVVTWKSIENPAFPQAEYDNAKKYQDERWFNQEYNAEISDVGGLVFPEFVEQDHTNLYEYNPDLPIYWGVDFGIHNPTYIGFWQFDETAGEEGHHYQFDELQIRDYKFDDVLTFALEKGYTDKTDQFHLYPKPFRSACDPSGKYREKIAGVGTIDVMYEYGLSPYWEKDWNTAIVRMQGIQTVHALLKKKMISYHRDKCYNILRAYSLYSRKPQKEGERAEEMPYKDGTSDHCMEAQFYHFMRPPMKMGDTGVYIAEDYEPSSEFIGF
jgi:hypothetical protein